MQARSFERGVMKKDLSVWQLSGFVFATALGTILHFLLGWTEAWVFAPVSAVNESTWEHMKILFFPMLIFAFIQSRFLGDDYEGFWWIKLIGIFVATTGIAVLFYTIGGAFGRTPGWVNVLIFFFAAGGGYLLEWWLFKKKLSWSKSWIALLLLSVVAIAYMIFTFFPPLLPLFQDPLTGTYGVVY